MKNRIRLFRALFVVILGFLAGALVVQAGPAAAAAKLVNLNTATQAELEALPHVGPSLAQKIIAARPFKSVDDLKNVSGIGQSTFDGLKDLVTVGTTKAVTTTETKSETKAKVKETAVSKELVNLNTASKAALENLPGVGSSLADAIIAARPFKSVDDLKNVKGIGQAKFKKLKKHVTVETVKSTNTKSTGEKSATQATGQAAAQKSVGGPVNLNTADKAALEALPGIGPALAEKIIAARPFKSIDDVKNVSGIGQTKFDGIKDLVVVDEEDAASVNPKMKPGETININKAAQDQLEKLLGIGPVKAKAIIDGRPYTKIEDIMKVKGIKEKTFAKIKDYIVVK